MKLTTIGTGTAAPSDRVNAGHLVEAGGVRMLMDCGSGVVHRMATLGIDWGSITHIAITHFHLDHILDIGTLFYAWRYGTMEPRTDPVTIIGPPGTLHLVERYEILIGGAPKLRELGFPVHVQGLAPEAGFIELRDGPVIEARRVPHNDESIAYSVRYGGRRIVYTGDTGPDPELGVWASEADLLLAECSLPDSMAIPTHLSPERCAALAATANPRQLVLTHFFPPAEQEPVADIVSQQYSGPVILATDGWSTTLEEK